MWGSRSTPVWAACCTDLVEDMDDLELIIAELERKKAHIQRAIDELRQAEATQTPEERRARLESAGARARRSRASRKGWEHRKAAQVEQSETGGGAQAA